MLTDMIMAGFLDLEAAPHVTFNKIKRRMSGTVRNDKGFLGGENVSATDEPQLTKYRIS
jgi:hypothetical protein